MLKNIFKISFRNLWKNKGYSAINIFGLAVGLATCLLITLYIMDELGYDAHFKKASQIFRINTDIRIGGANMHFTQTSDMMGPLLKKDYPQVEEYTRIYTNEGDKLVKKENEYINEKMIAYVDSTFFTVFSLPAIDGNTNTALNEPNTVVITESTAYKYFKTTHVLGKMIEIKNRELIIPYKITAVIKDIPANTHFNFDFLLSMKNANYTWGQLTSHNFHTYLLLNRGNDQYNFQKGLDNYILKYVLPEAKKFMHIKSMDEFKKAGNAIEYSLLPLTKIHLYSDYSYEISAPGSIQYIYIFASVALFILLIACINFMNLSTARSASRAKEIGIRKVLGTYRNTLIVQFLVESIITAFISLLIALGITWFALPLFNSIAAKTLSFTDLINSNLLPLILILPVLVGLLAGIYPALFLSNFKPIDVLKGNANSGFKKSNLRNVLVIFQFTTSIILIFATIIVYQQLYYIQHTKLGFNKEQVLVIDGTYALNKNAAVFKNEVLSFKGVQSGTLSSFLPVNNSSRTDNTYSKEAVMNSKNGIDMQTWTIDYDYLKTMGMEIIRGRAFSKEFGTDSTALLITETTEKLMGYQDAIGKKLYVPSNNPGDNSMVSYDIIGIIKDFHFESLRQNIGPLCMKLGNSTGLASFKITTENPQQLISQIGNKWKTMAPGLPFSYRFLNDSFNEMYLSEQRAGTIAIVFSIIAVMIACFGLFGLVTYMAEQRTKEIGIRKVLGATVSNVVTLLSKDFLILVLIACVFALPVAWWAMNEWLQDFAYRMSISWWVFVVSGLLAFIIALITVSFKAIKAARSNPIKSLRTE